jgi:hypothetical protein
MRDALCCAIVVARGPSMRRCSALIVFISAIACATLAAGPAVAAAAGKAVVDVQRDGETFRVDATLFAPVPLDVAWDVLTDFDGMARFVPNIATSRVVSRDGNRLTIEQRGLARFGPLAFGFTSERLIELAPRSEIRSIQTRGNMRRLESMTRFGADEGGTTLVYRVEVEPGALYPAALTERFLRDEIGEQFDAIVREMVRRHGARAR